MAELQKAPTVEEGMIPKILKVLDAGIMPGTTEYFQALGVSAKDRGIMPSDQLPPIISGLRDKFSREAQKLIKEQAVLQEVGMGIMKTVSEQTAQLKAKNDFANANAPTYDQLRRAGINLQPETQYKEQEGPGAPMVVPVEGGTPGPGTQLLPPPRNEPGVGPVYDMAGGGVLQVSPDYMRYGLQEGPRPVTGVQNYDAKINPFERQMLDDITQGRAVMQDGKYTPMALAKPPTNLMSPEQINELMRISGSDDQVPPARIPLPTTGVNQLLQRQQPAKQNMGIYIESLAAIESKNKFGRPMTFTQLADQDPALAKQVRDQAANQERKEMYNFEQDQLAKRQMAVAGPIAEAGAKAREGVAADIRLSGPTMIMDELTNMVDKLFLPEEAGGMARAKHAVSLRARLFNADPDVVKWNRSIQTAMRPQLARAEGEVGNLAAQEQLNAGELIPDLMGGQSQQFPFVKLPDTKETAIERLKLATEFISLASRAPNGERETSAVQQKLRGIKSKLDMLDDKAAKAANKGEKPLGDLSKDEFEYAKNLAAQGLSKDRVEAMIRQRRSK